MKSTRRICGPVTWIFLLAALSVAAADRKQYAMYVWADGYDPDVPGCTETDFLSWTNPSMNNNPCFTHSWNTPEKRRWLWNTCNSPGREISTIFLAGLHRLLEAGYRSDDCTTDGVQLIKTTLQDGYRQVPGLQVYALYAVSDLAVSEQLLVKHVVWYNDMCAGNQERFVGVATNNEAFTHVKCGTPLEKVNYLQNLDNIRAEARKQTTGHLKVHYSMSWHWGRACDHVTDNVVLWNGKDQKITRHMIDIFDSVDVQVAYVTPSEMARRAKLADYDYAVAQGKNIFITSYTEKVEPCQITFFPQSCAPIYGGKSEAAMFAAYDELASHGVGEARPCIEYYRGVYSSGGNSDWPRHDSGVPVDLPDPVVSGPDQTVLVDCGFGSYCKCWLDPPTCHGTDMPCQCHNHD
ncbi:Hypp7694 [Branchiostoma lanceolatum]|uniref:Hypp7694 protein n=1 Tax=Branchiostoma lanceolatum TaxID=7740 RepID=A0A8J9Z346_BRALA|nr:Hypp7694 [Branchiostoma lanceolatum]